MSKTALKRTSLYASGSSAGKVLEARFYNQDCIVYDLEDSVSPAEKDAARFLIYHTVRYHRPPDKYVLIRVNGLYSEYIEEDLQAAVRARPDAIRLPKVEHAEEVRRIDAKITEIVQEEISEYLGGVRSAEECAKMIQSRAGLWLAEHE